MSNLVSKSLRIYKHCWW